MNLTLPPEVENALAAAAQQKGTTPELLALECLRDKFLNGAQPTQYPPGSLAEYLKDYIGAISSKDRFPEGSRMSEDTGKKFAEGMVEKHRQGRL